MLAIVRWAFDTSNPVRNPAVARLLAGTVCTLAVLVGGCSHEQFTVALARDFPSGSITVSPFGVFRNGLMSEEAWSTLQPSVARVFHRSVCEAGFGSGLGRAKPELLARVEDSARSNGITDELLTEITPYAKGDFVGVFYMYGDVANDASAAHPTLLAHGGDAHSDAPPKYSAKRTLEVSVSIFSKRTQHTVAMLSMAYSGSSTEEALRNFSARVATVFPGAVCSGWDWTTASENRPAAQ